MRKNFKELEELFDSWQQSPDQLRVLADELGHRKRPKALRLLERVEARLNAKEPSSPAAVPPKTQRSLFEADELVPATRTNSGRSHPGLSPPSAKKVDDGDYFAPPSEFTTVQPVGTQPRPTAFVPKLKDDLQLEVDEDSPRVTVFRVGLRELIAEMRRRRTGQQQFALEDGQRVNTDAAGYSYQFEFGEDANIFEGANVELIVGGQAVFGRLTAIFDHRIVVTLQEDFGEFIHTCVLRIDNTALLQALHDRLECIERGEVSAFRTEFAEGLLKNAGGPFEPQPVDRWPWPQKPTANQRRFLEVALANDVSWLWGPPGTGKTDTLSALIKLLYDSNNRVLICSNTNQAVDQVLYKLCAKLAELNDKSLGEGRVLRLGRIEDELKETFGEFIEPDRIVERKSAELVKRQVEIEATLEQMGRAVAYAEDVIRRFEQLDEAQTFADECATEVQKRQKEIEQCEFRVKTSDRAYTRVTNELVDFEHAGFFRRLILRDEVTIRRDIVAKESEAQNSRALLDDARRALSEANERESNALRAVAPLRAAVDGEDRQQSQLCVAKYNAERQPLRDELAEIASKLESIRNAVLSDARIVGATVTRTYMRPAEFSSFDVIIVDEASMILLPAVFQLAGLAKFRFIVAGDFQQLPPIVQTEQQAIHDILASDVFTEAGITHNTAETTPRLVMLDEQFRMDRVISELVSGVFYGGRLKTHPNRTSNDFHEPSPLVDRLTIIDTSSVWPFTTKNIFNSRLNLMHGLVVRNLVLHLQEHDRLCGADKKGRVGVCTPYAAQAALVRDIFKARKITQTTLRVSTVHGFQGDERDVMVIDLVDSVGERNVGIFLQSCALTDAGAKLSNVAFSRAKEGLIVVANLTFLDQKLPSNAILRDLLHDIQRKAHIVDAREVLALHPVLDDLQRFDGPVDVNPEALRTGLFDGDDFEVLSRHDMENAKESIVVFSGFITPKRTAVLGDLFRRKVAEGVKIRCVTRPPNRNGSIPEELGREAIAALESVGVAIDLRNAIHEKCVFVDDRILWFGSLNPLSHTARTDEMMIRVDDAGIAQGAATGLTKLRRSKDGISAFSTAENPRCDSGHLTVYIEGRYGPFFSCVENCGWKQNLDAARRKRR